MSKSAEYLAVGLTDEQEAVLQEITDALESSLSSFDCATDDVGEVSLEEFLGSFDSCIEDDSPMTLPNQMPNEFMKMLAEEVIKNRRLPLPSFPVRGNVENIVRIPTQVTKTSPRTAENFQEVTEKIYGLDGLVHRRTTIAWNDGAKTISEWHRNGDSWEYSSRYLCQPPESPQTTQQCRSCSYYCGQIHNGNRLVCAVHPSGPDVEGECEDWEGK